MLLLRINTQVIGHVHQTTSDAYVGKRAIPQYLGRYNWSLARELKGPEVFFASTPGRALPQAVALVPCLDWDRIVRTVEDFKVGGPVGGWWPERY